MHISIKTSRFLRCRIHTRFYTEEKYVPWQRGSTSRTPRRIQSRPAERTAPVPPFALGFFLAAPSTRQRECGDTLPVVRASTRRVSQGEGQERAGRRIGRARRGDAGGRRAARGALIDCRPQGLVTSLLTATTMHHRRPLPVCQVAREQGLVQKNDWLTASLKQLTRRESGRGQCRGGVTLIYKSQCNCAQVPRFDERRNGLD